MASDYSNCAYAFDQYAGQPKTSDSSGSIGSLIKDIQETTAKILRLVMIMGAGLGVTLGVFHMMKGDKEGVSKLFYMAIGCGIGFALLTFLPGIGGGATDVDASNESLGTIQAAVKGLLQSALSIVCMFTLTGVVYQVVTGTQESSKKLFNWALTSGIGLAVLSAF